jgi:hypothetical protein
VQHERVRERLRHHIAQDVTVAATSKPAHRTSTEAIDVLMLEIAREAAALAWDSERAVIEGRRQAERIASRRVGALVKIAELALERARLGETFFDPRDPRVQAIVREFLRQMREAAEETLDRSSVERFFEKFDQLSSGWEGRVPG